MRAALVLLVLLPALVPAAGAQSVCVPGAGAVAACAYQDGWTAGDCEAGEGVTQGSNAVDVSSAAGVGLYAYGWQNCYDVDGARGEQEIVGGTVSTPLATVSAIWNRMDYDDPDFGTFEDCYLFVYATYAERYEACPGGVGPPNPGWGFLLPEMPQAAIPEGCTFHPVAYHCVEEEQGECYEFTAVGVGLGGVTGATFGGIDECRGGYVTASASVGLFYVNVVWMEFDGQCAVIVSGSGLPAAEAPCAAGGPPDLGWGGLLP